MRRSGADDVVDWWAARRRHRSRAAVSGRRRGRTPGGAAVSVWNAHGQHQRRRAARPARQPGVESVRRDARRHRLHRLLHHVLHLDAGNAAAQRRTAGPSRRRQCGRQHRVGHRRGAARAMDRGPTVNQPCLKLTTYFGERQRAVTDNVRRPGFLADAMLDLFDTREVATSVMLRGIASFGPRHVLRTDESLSLSEDPPVAIAAVDVESTISGLVNDVVAMTGHGLVTLERARLIGGDDLIEVSADDAVKLTVYVGRQERIGGLPAYRAVCDLLYRQGFSGGAVSLGVDGTAHGERYRAQFFSRNVNVPLMIISIGTAAQISTVVAKLSAVAPRALLTVERVRLCKRGGELFARPHRLPDTDNQGRPLWQKLMVHTSEATGHGGMPIHRALVHQLLESGMAHGATVLRGIWGFHGDHKPHGDKIFQLTRRMPVVTVIVDTPAAIARSFDIVHELTAEHGLVTSEMVPAVVTIAGPDRHGDGLLARHDY